jgi:hypothetical protein
MTKKTEPAKAPRLWSNSDLALVACLVNRGFKIVSLDRTLPNKIQFQFEQTPELEQTVEDFWADRLMVSPRIFFDNIRLIKNRIYSE